MEGGEERRGGGTGENGGKERRERAMLVCPLLPPKLSWRQYLLTREAWEEPGNEANVDLY